VEKFLVRVKGVKGHGKIVAEEGVRRMTAMEKVPCGGNGQYQCQVVS
jgi:hypothetical protein